MIIVHKPVPFLWQIAINGDYLSRKFVNVIANKDKPYFEKQ